MDLFRISLKRSYKLIIFQKLQGGYFLLYVLGTKTKCGRYSTPVCFLWKYCQVEFHVQFFQEKDMLWK